jgi:FKBP-type peptidyl-prolyl cis-trans isomerase 2
MRHSGSVYTLPAILIALAVVIASVFAAYVTVFNAPHEPADTESLVVAKNATVKVDYIGTFTDGKVFDTSLQSVAFDDAKYPKALTYERRDTAYEPLSFTVGARQMIVGFDDGVLGMVVGETRWITVPPEKGYGNPDATQIITRPMQEEIPVYIDVNLAGFAENFSAQPRVGVVLEDPYWGWNSTVYFVDEGSGIITLRYEPAIGSVVQPYGYSWGMKVVAVDEAADGGAGRITLLSLLTPGDANRLKGKAPNGQEFRVVAVDLAAQTYDLDFNKEVLGRTLIFQVTVVSITPATTEIVP